MFENRNYFHMRNRLILTLIFIFSLLYCSAQFINFGQDRASLRWKQIKTDDFQIIYPDFFEENAQKMANIYARLYQHANTLHQRPRKISMIVHADGGVANGNVALVPRKSELYTMPPQDPTDSWLEHLCVHEFRHVVQFDKVNQGLTKGLSYLFGELFPIAVIGVYVPMWYMEGDAVAFESSVGKIGRGRSPEFLNQMKAQVIEKGIYNYTKAVVGSNKDFVPNRYALGYFMTANSRINYGPEIWIKALERSGRRPYGITPFSKSLKLTMREKRDSLWNDAAFHALFSNPDSVRKANTFADTKRMLYRDNFSQLRQIWKRGLDKPYPSFDTINTHNKYYANYYYPTPLENQSIIAYKQGLQQTGAFVSLRDGREKLLTRTGIPDDYKFSVHNGKIVWSEYHPHVRWTQGGRMRLSSYDLNSGRYTHKRGKENQFSPFPVGNNWGYVSVNNRNECSIVIADSSLQNEISRFPAKEGELFIHPSWNNGVITTVVQSSQGLRIENIDVSTGECRALTSNMYYEIDNPIAKDSTVFFRASFNGNNALYSLDGRGTRYLLDSPYGIRFPNFALDSNSLYFSYYTADGYKPGKIRLTEWQSKPVEYKQFWLADSMTKQENWQLPLKADSVYTTRKYNKFLHLVNIHSWGPLNIDINDIDVELGAVIYSQNKLSTLSFTAGYVLKSGYDHGAWLLNATYSGWWPVLQFELQSGREDYYTFVQGLDLQQNIYQSLYVHNKALRSSADLIVRFPFNLSVKQYNRSFQPYVRYKVEALHRMRPDKIYALQEQDSTIFIYPADHNQYGIHQTSRFYQLMEYGFSFSNQTRMTDQEINPRWGQTFSGGFTHSLSEGMDIGYQWWGDGRLYFPGIAINHSLSVYGGFQHMSNHTRNYGNKILYPRGISLYGYEIASLRNTYRLPLCFPDKAISSLLYFKNIEAGLFYDLGTSRHKLKTYTYSSYGLELTTDTHFLRLTYPVHLGIRTGYENQTKKMFANLIFSIGLSI